MVIPTDGQFATEREESPSGPASAGTVRGGSPPALDVPTPRAVAGATFGNGSRAIGRHYGTPGKGRYRAGRPLTRIFGLCVRPGCRKGDCLSWRRPACLKSVSVSQVSRRHATASGSVDLCPSGVLK